LIKNEGLKRSEASQATEIGCLRGASPLFRKLFSPSLIEGRGIKGDRVYNQGVGVG